MKALLATMVILSALLAAPVYADTLPVTCKVTVYVDNSQQGVVVTATLLDVSNSKRTILGSKLILPGTTPGTITANCTGVTTVKVMASEASAPGNTNLPGILGSRYTPPITVAPNKDGAFPIGLSYPSSFGMK